MPPHQGRPMIHLIPIFIRALLGVMPLLHAETPGTYEPTQASLSRHITPEWFRDAKFGVLLHWGLYSVPSYAPLTGPVEEVVARDGWEAWFRNHPGAEWYANSLQLTNSPVREHHLKTFGAQRDYESFTNEFQLAARNWSPQAWSDLLHDSGARYLVFTAKHHDGFALWPSAHPIPNRSPFQADRNLVADLARAVREHHLHFGIFYSGGLDWHFTHGPILQPLDLLLGAPQHTNYLIRTDRQYRELIDTIHPDLLWNDLGLPRDFKSLELLAHYYNTVQDGVVNDRFHSTPPSELERPPADFNTLERGSILTNRPKPFEWVQPLGQSPAYNHAEPPTRLATAGELIQLLVEVSCRNGNLLLQIGADAQGHPPPATRERLSAMGAWLKIRGPGVLGTRPWIVTGTRSGKGTWLRFNQTRDSLYVLAMAPLPEGPLQVRHLRLMPGSVVTEAGGKEPVPWSQQGDNLTLRVGPDPNPALASPIRVLKITPQPFWTLAGGDSDPVAAP